jgi:hypothetical protein
VIGLAQWLVLRGRFKDIGWWILTPMVCLFLWYMLDFSRNPILGLMLGALIGAGQWLLLRNPIDHEAVRQGGGS